MNEAGNTAPATEPKRGANAEAALRRAAETLRAFMRDGGYENYTITVTHDSIMVNEPRSAYPQPPKQKA